MAKFRVQVTCIVERTYTVEVDASTEDRAEQAAGNQWRDQLQDFDVDKPDRWKFESQQLTAECPDCGLEHDIPHDDLRVCHCGAFVSDADPDPRYELHRLCHPLVDGNCVPAPWWWQDQDYCAGCGKLAEERDAKELREKEARQDG